MYLGRVQESELRSCSVQGYLDGKRGMREDKTATHILNHNPKCEPLVVSGQLQN